VLAPLETISAKIPQHQREQIAAFAGDRGLSAGLRDVIAAGLLVMLPVDVAPLAPVDELQQLADRLARIQGRRTPAGAWWAPASAALPSAESLDPGGAVLVTPQQVALIADGSVMVDLAAGEITITHAVNEARVSIDLSDLAGPAALLPAALAGLAATGPGRRDLGLGLAVERTAENLCRVTLQGISAGCSPDIATTFAAELVGLMARSARASFDTREALERQVAGVQP
jgi:hypothetical protein